jgi:hypothetical protein
MTIMRRLDLVGAVTIRANRSPLVTLKEQLTMNAPVVHLLDLDMALAAGLGHVGMVDG